MFRKAAVILASVSLVFALSACGKSGGNALPTVSSPVYGTVPEISFPAGNPPKSVVMKVLDEGDGKGATVGENDLVVVDYYGKVWGGALLPDSTITDATGPRAISLVDPPIEGWSSLKGAKTGQRVLLVVPPQQAYGDLGSESIGVKKGDTLAYVVDIRSTVSPDAASQFQTTPTNNPLPAGVTVTASDKGAMIVDAKAARAYPTKQETAVYATGNGSAVAPGQSVVIKQVVANWGEASTPEAWTASKLSATSASVLNLENQPLGTIAVVLYPATPSSEPQATLVQILAAYDAGR